MMHCINYPHHSSGSEIIEGLPKRTWGPVSADNPEYAWGIQFTEKVSALRTGLFIQLVIALALIPSLYFIVNELLQGKESRDLTSAWQAALASFSVGVAVALCVAPSFFSL